ncbi:MAG: hypothetical protein HY508_15410 [Acidobacteria bacterium]|nr:hypothetical protein [Acidobacteriota bacterium]
MTINRQSEKWITAGLGLVALVLVVNMVFRGKPAPNQIKGATAAKPSTASPKKEQSQRAWEELTRYDPALSLEELKSIQERPEAKLKRNPFEFVARETSAAPVPDGPAPAPTTPQPPAAPAPPPLKAVGYTQSGGGPGEAFVTLQDELYVVHEGESFAKRFRVNKLSPAAVEVFDETTQQTIRLPIGG